MEGGGLHLYRGHALLGFFFITREFVNLCRNEVYIAMVVSVIYVRFNFRGFRKKENMFKNTNKCDQRPLIIHMF